jgi:hypothetical protein
MQKYLSPVAKPLIMSSASPMPWILPHLSTIMKLKQTAPQEPPPKRVEVVPMANSPLRNILSAVRLGLGFEDARASQLAQQQLLSHREEPELQHVFHVHSNASQTAHYAHTHDYLSAQQAQLDKVPKEQALTDPRQKAERDAILKKTSIVSTGGPQAATDLPDPNRSMLVRHQDVVPQLLTAALLKGKASSPNLQMFGPQFPPVPDEATFAGMEPEEIGAMLIKTMVTGVGEHAYTKYQKPAEGVTKQVVDSTSKSTRVHVGEGVFGTDAGAKKRAKEVEDALRK